MKVIFKLIGLLVLTSAFSSAKAADCTEIYGKWETAHQLIKAADAYHGADQDLSRDEIRAQFVVSDFAWQLQHEYSCKNNGGLGVFPEYIRNVVDVLVDGNDSGLLCPAKNGVNQRLSYQEFIAAVLASLGCSEK